MNETIHIKCAEGIDEWLENLDVDYEYDERDKIEDVDNFKRELNRQGLMTEKLEEFIENYMRWDNN